MSFAGEVKAELCRGKLGRKCCAQAEACGVLLYCNRFSLSEVKIVTESPAFAQRLPGLFRKAFGVEFDEKGDPDTPGKRIFTISAPEKLALLWELCAFDPSGPAHHINFGMLEETHCRLAFLRGAFLAGGSVTDPQKGYHRAGHHPLRVSRELTPCCWSWATPPRRPPGRPTISPILSRARPLRTSSPPLGPRCPPWS
ncbi:MAG: DNA-binding protein WhiA [Evtepia gabavorous]